MRGFLFIVVGIGVVIAALVIGCRQPQKSVYSPPKGESIAGVLLPPQETGSGDAAYLQIALPGEALMEIAAVAQSCPGIDWRQRTVSHIKANDKMSRADVFLAALAAAKTDGAEVLCMQGDIANAVVTREPERSLAIPPTQIGEVALALSVKGPELSWKTSSVQYSFITPAEILVRVSGEHDHSPLLEPSKEKKDTKAADFEWDPREWVESIFADSRSAGRRLGEM